MNKELKELLDDLKKWINSPLDEIDKNYGIWELDVNQSKELLNYIFSLKQALNEIRGCCENDALEVNTREYGNLVVTSVDDILQIIDKVLGDEE